MSALASSRVNQIKKNEIADGRVDDVVKTSTTSISIIARIDYIQRFSGHMTVVFDQSPAVYSKVARQYLANISQESSQQEINVAFVAASNKINDIQMRCRLIEQLFGNTLFDPEQSLAVSVLRLAKQSNGVITIIVEHAQSLSLQVKYELCQLVDIAKKTKSNINVVIFGLEQMAKEIGQNKTIFDKKTSIIEASSVQVFPLDHARFKNNVSIFKNKISLKIGVGALVGLVTAIVLWFLLTESKSGILVSLPALPVVSESQVTEQKTLEQKELIASNDAIAQQETMAQQKIMIEQEAKLLSTQDNLASVSDIHFALLDSNIDKDKLVAKAENEDILQALMLVESAVSDNKIQTNLEKPALLSTKAQVASQEVNVSNAQQEPLSNLPILSSILNDQYYLNSEGGYVVQLTGFSDLSRLEQFVKQNNGIEYFSYQKELNAQKFFVLTSKIFKDRAQAREAINKLPQALNNLGAFLKSVSTIKREINIVNQ